MGNSGPKWLPGPLLLDTPLHLLLGPSKILVLSAFTALYVLAKLWHGQVTSLVPASYLDEVFHVPQAQAYCEGKYGVWDPKLTTPPGLYAFAVMFVKSQINGICDVYKLRLFNVFALLFIMVYAIDCRALITSRSLKILSPGIVSAETGHTAFNIALFPPLFFFSGLFYTDVLSTAMVLRMYRLFLQGEKGTGVWMVGTGLVALTMRQTNIFWVAVFMGGLEAVRAVERNVSRAVNGAEPKTWAAVFKEWSQGHVHDVSLAEAGIHDFVLCAISIVIAILASPLLILQTLWPYLTLLASFTTFVLWNGSVVLGDKSNHVATIHLPQMLYLWPFIAFFSFPIIVPAALSFTKSLFTSSTPPKPLWKYLLNTIFAIGALGTALVVVKYNTIIHPFTLADNRHYIFYVFRYSILRHPLIRYLLAPIYLICAYSVFLTLSGPPPPLQLQSKSKKQNNGPKEQNAVPRTSFALLLVATTALSLVTAPLVEPRYFIIPWVMWRLHVPRGGKALWGETTWFLVVSGVTGYVFLYRGFEWKQEVGVVQRFMW